MTRYQLVFTKQAMEDLKAIQRQDANRILLWLDANISSTQNPRGQGKNLVGVADGWRYRVGKYRILFRIIDEKIVVEVFRIGKRGDVYKR